MSILAFPLLAETAGLLGKTAAVSGEANYPRSEL